MRVASSSTTTRRKRRHRSATKYSGGRPRSPAGKGNVIAIRSTVDPPNQQVCALRHIGRVSTAIDTRMKHPSTRSRRVRIIRTWRRRPCPSHDGHRWHFPPPHSKSRSYWRARRRSSPRPIGMPIGPRRSTRRAHAPTTPPPANRWEMGDARSAPRAVGPLSCRAGCTSLSASYGR